MCVVVSLPRVISSSRQQVAVIIGEPYISHVSRMTKELLVLSLIKHQKPINTLEGLAYYHVRHMLRMILYPMEHMPENGNSIVDCTIQIPAIAHNIITKIIQLAEEKYFQIHTQPTHKTNHHPLQD